MSSSPRMGVAPFKIKLSEQGTIRDIKKMIVRIAGLPSCLNGQIVEFGSGSKGIIMGFDEDEVLALVLGDDSGMRLGQPVSGTSEPFTIPVGEAFLGRMVDALGNVVDGKGEVAADGSGAVFAISTPITARAPVDELLYSGTKVVDTLVPVGKGQRQLVLGDRMTGKTTLGVDAILSQRGRNVVCIYCCIGKAVTALEKVVSVLSERKALDYTIVVAAPDSASAGEQYIVPFSAATLGEYFMLRGRDVLVVLDDLTKHAWAYRQLSLLLERPPGREAYPGDIFYIQTQLMERAGRLGARHGGGSMTFLAIADLLQGDLTGYIPSNLISICDGMVCLSSSLFAEGVRPAVDLNLSISIVGGRAQPPILRELGSTLRRDFMHYTELLRLSRLQTGLSQAAERVLRRGQAIVAMLQQPPNNPVPLGAVVLPLYALRMGILEEMDSADVVRFLAELAGFADTNDPMLMGDIERKPELTPELEKRLRVIVESCIARRKE